MVEGLHTFSLSVGIGDIDRQHPFRLSVDTDFGHSQVWVSYDTIKGIIDTLDKARQNYEQITRLHQGYH